MKIPFSNALYYPHIDIRDSNWLKTAVLFWDSISTIVPSSINTPYENRETEYLADAGFLRPVRVNSESESVIGIEEKIINLLTTPDFLKEIFLSNLTKSQEIYGEKMSNRLRIGIRESFNIYQEKMSDRVRHEIRDRIYKDKASYKTHRHLERLLRDYPYFMDDEKFYLSDKFAYVYMTALANQICENERMGLVTDNLTYHDFANSLRFENKSNLNNFEDIQNFGQGMLLDFIIEDLKICPDTSLEDIIFFKNQHRDELTLFRLKLAEITQNISPNRPINYIRQEMADAYKIFEAEYNNFKKALKSQKIKWTTGNFLKTSSAFVTSVAIPMHIGAPTDIAVLIGVGVSATVSIINYRVDRQNALRENPYSYLLKVETQW